MKTIAIIYLLVSTFYSAECMLKRYSAREKENIQPIKFIDHFLPKFVELNDVTLMLFTRKNVENDNSFKPDQAAKLKESKVFNPKNPNFFIIHGWATSHKNLLCKAIKNGILQKTDMNVFVADWKRPASWTYKVTRGVISKIGDFIAHFINDMAKIFALPTSSFKIVGHSIGAHVAGCTGRKVNGQVDYIIGLDPARPLFKLSDADKLNISDASFVQVIHTGAAFYGFDSSLGHVDIFANNGYQQPGCEFDLTHGCCHGRAHEYYSESIISGGFTTKRCDTYKEYKDGKCNNNPSSYLGGANIDKTDEKIRNESPDSRSDRLAKDNLSQKKRIRNESPNTRALRMTKDNLKKKEKIRNESPDSSASRLAKINLKRKERIRNKSPNSRTYRMTQDNLRKKKKYRNESPNSCAAGSVTLPPPT